MRNENGEKNKNNYFYGYFFYMFDYNNFYYFKK